MPYNSSFLGLRYMIWKSEEQKEFPSVYYVAQFETGT